jgi:alkanesulfonate monooxygenase SsuD/methylene tetrahydromethanopterin reductase-like flavin-dependent oxidoreductase (luciferase family)
MKAIWTQDDASYAGESVAFDRIWSWPKPTQEPRLPVLVGGTGRAAHRVVAFGDAWFPGHDVARTVMRVERLSTRLLA